MQPTRAAWKKDSPNVCESIYKDLYMFTKTAVYSGHFQQSKGNRVQEKFWVAAFLIRYMFVSIHVFDFT